MYRYFLALRYLLSRPINGLGMIAFTLAVWALIVVISIFSGFIDEVKHHVRSATSDIIAFYLGDRVDYRSLEAVLLAHPNVAACAPRLTYPALLHPDPERTKDVAPSKSPFGQHHLVTLIGIDPQLEANVTGLDEWLTATADADLQTTRADANLGTNVEDPWILLSEIRAGREAAKKGTVLQTTTASTSPAPGQPGSAAGLDLVDHGFRMAGAFATRHSGFDEINAFVHIDVLRKLLGKPNGFVSEIMIGCKNPDLREATAKDLAAALANLPEYRHWVPFVQPWEVREQAYLQNIEHQRLLFKLVLIVIMVVSTFLVFATLSMMVTEKTHDIGILTAMGATPGGVMQVFLGCGFAISLIGTIAGIVMGCVTAMNLDGIRHVVLDWFGIDLFPIHTYNLPRVPYELDPIWIAQVAGAAIALGLVVAVMPALRAAFHSPLQSLRNE